MPFTRACFLIILHHSPSFLFSLRRCFYRSSISVSLLAMLSSICLHLLHKPVSSAQACLSFSSGITLALCPSLTILNLSGSVVGLSNRYSFILVGLCLLHLFVSLHLMTFCWPSSWLWHLTLVPALALGSSSSPWFQL